MLDSVLGFFSSSGVGAIVGAVGSWAAKREARKIKQLDNEHEKDMANIGIQETKQEHEHAMALADKEIQKLKQEGETKIEIGELGAFTESLKTLGKNSGVLWVDAVRSLMRPLITTYLLALTTYIAYLVNSKAGGIEALPPSEIYALYSHIINQTMFLTTVAVTWWFGSRDWGKAR